MNLIEMWQQMGFFAKAIAWVLFIMSMISFGVAIAGSGVLQVFVV